MLSAEEVEGISDIVYKNTERKEREIVNYIVYNKDKFKEIRKPENINDDNGYEKCYCIWLEEEVLNGTNDIVDLQYDYLIKSFFNKEKIITVLSGKQESYFKASHFLYSLSVEHESWYNSFFFIQRQEGKIQRLQKRNVKTLNYIMPVQYFSKDDRTMTVGLLEKITRQNLLNALHGEKVEDERVPVMLRASLKKIEEISECINRAELEEIFDILCAGSVLQFLLFVYACSDEMFWKENRVQQIRERYLKIKECVTGCEQLMENVINHSLFKTGAISIRFHKPYKDYLKSRYHILDDSKAHLEVLITDYAGINTTGNLAKNFWGKLEPEDKKRLCKLKPIDFLLNSDMEESADREVCEELEKLYYRADNIGKHLGLKIFKKIVESNNGKFAFYSHDNHVAQEGENYNYSENAMLCMPGTGYTVLFPIESKTDSKEVKAEIAIDNNIYLRQNINEFVQGYECSSILFDNAQFEYQNQEEKEEKISALVESFKRDRIGEEGRKKIVYVSTKNLQNNSAEFFCKALIVAFCQKSIPDYVFFDCSQSFVDAFCNTISIYYERSDIEKIFSNREFTIALYGANPIESVFFIPGDYTKTIWVNQTNCYSGNFEAIRRLFACRDKDKIEMKNDRNIPPYDIVYEVSNKTTLFEQYTKQILESDIQEQGFGCKITNTHMRLGSTIHINTFYEAELLLGVRLFVNRFAYLLVKDIGKSAEFQETSRVTLYSYALYSELLIVQVVELLSVLFPDKDIDYAILEREEDHREFAHIDRIRYGKGFECDEERREYFSNRRIICIVPINSTLKTHEKLLSKFAEDNGENCKTNIILNYALILVGSNSDNNYWKLNKEQKTFNELKLSISPIPKYFVEVSVDYFEANQCKLCFPKSPLGEVPLIEVNAASTVPNQAFGLYGKNGNDIIDYAWIAEQEKDMRELKDVLVYKHSVRGENHFLYYFKTKGEDQ